MRVLQMLKYLPLALEKRLIVSAVAVICLAAPAVTNAQDSDPQLLPAPNSDVSPDTEVGALEVPSETPTPPRLRPFTAAVIEGEETETVQPPEPEEVTTTSDKQWETEPAPVAVAEEATKPIIAEEPAPEVKTETPPVVAPEVATVTPNKPKLRPSSLASAEPAQSSPLEPTVARPKLRPNLPQLTSTTTEDAIANDLLQQAIRADKERERKLQNASKLAAVVNTRPPNRPRNLATLKPARPDPADEQKPETVVASVEPAKPEPKNTRVSTTFNKRTLSLVGVFGTPSNRKVLFRTPGGSYQTKKMGQSVSGWKVVAIGESTVKIVRGSRDRTLRMPE